MHEMFLCIGCGKNFGVPKLQQLANWADTVVHLLLLKGSMKRQLALYPILQLAHKISLKELSSSRWNFIPSAIWNPTTF